MNEEASLRSWWDINRPTYRMINLQKPFKNILSCDVTTKYIDEMELIRRKGNKIYIDQ